MPFAQDRGQRRFACSFDCRKENLLLDRHVSFDAAAEECEGISSRIPFPGMGMRHRRLERMLQTAMIIGESFPDASHRKGI
jgi:hypothetical protein